MKKAIQFGAGNIGRGFIGALLEESGYEVVFADVIQDTIDRINSEKKYKIFIKDVELEEIEVKNISAVNSNSKEIIDEIKDAEIITTAVGPNVLKIISATLREGLKSRFESEKKDYLNIIACENAVYASSSLKEYIMDGVEGDLKDYIDTYVGFPNCSVDRIVPPSHNENPLDVTVEKYYEWNVEKGGFKGDIPVIDGMNLADNLLAYIERKLFTLNTGHAICAYLGNLKGLPTIDKAIEDKDVFAVVKGAMQESGLALVNKFGFEKEVHFAYIDKIIKRFKNPYLQDDVKRVGREPLRKLSDTDRLVKPMMTAREYGIETPNLIKGIAAALHYKNNDDKQANELQEMIENSGIEETIKKVTNIKDDKLISDIVREYKEL